MSTQVRVHRRSIRLGAPSPSPRPVAIAAGGELQLDVRHGYRTHHRPSDPISMINVYGSRPASSKGRNEREERASAAREGATF
ncbi:hypothetical protein ACLOJK_022987 [Asimina triloba]